MYIKEPQIIRNIAQCLLCKDIIESVHRHDTRWCSCGEIGVDGGKSYIKRMYKNDPTWVELSEFETQPDIISTRELSEILKTKLTF
jgi:hypothetical protein